MTTTPDKKTSASPSTADAHIHDEPDGHVHGPNCNHGHHHQMPVRKVPRPGRNEPCHCGSGRKYKKCCLGADQARGG
jgi:uncharacterized protein YecA (UPF0149 family)